MSRCSNREERIERLRKEPRFRALVDDLRCRDPERVAQMARDYLMDELDDAEVTHEGQEGDARATD